MPQGPAMDGQLAALEGHKTWFDHMTGYLKWKVIGPDMNNPYKTPVPFHILTRMANQRDYLAQHIQIRCMCDGYEVMIIVNPACPRIVSSHPCISTMAPDSIVDYIKRASLDEFIDSEIDRIETEIREHLATRSKEKEEQTALLAKKKKPGENGRLASPSKDSSRSKGYRILKR